MMLVPSGVRVHIALGVTDLRKGLDGLAMLVQEVLEQDPFSGHLFAFRGRKASRTTFSIPFAIRQNRVSMASVAWTAASRSSGRPARWHGSAHGRGATRRHPRASRLDV